MCGHPWWMLDLSVSEWGQHAALTKSCSRCHTFIPLVGIGKRKEEPLLSSPIPARGATLWSNCVQWHPSVTVGSAVKVAYFLSWYGGSIGVVIFLLGASNSKL